MRKILAALLLLTPVSAKATDFYIGAFGNAAFIDATVRRGTAEINDLGGDGLGAGLRAGVGWRPFNRVYTGAEIEGIVQFNTDSKAAVVGYSRSVYYSGAIYGRLGYEWPDRGMLFLRGGGAWVNTSNGSYTTPAFGGGMEVYLSPRWSLRADATYYWPNGTDNFEQVVITGGLTLRF